MSNTGGFSMEFYAAWSATQVALPTVWDLPIPQLKGCFGRMPKSAVKRTLFGWIPSVVIAFMFLAMTLAKFRQSLRDHRARGGSSLSPLFLIIVRDGALFFFLKGFIIGLLHPSPASPHDS
ncbi:hypothetical protein CC1G_09877 [Coprinopsis cinerea okayama7|uniref:Uncharacterized protein n=1 Tax=Coprinopsis cinerea (strain Okayama-7 / 130 / ATCC MYA-4618 / FGSC 9003) TaxID=240176 RepID=A8N8L8_COPC7|nr:hypothetical protein CC1G_09877 [Coprinopsis cinerea okayama7\|eukprot:XP_001831174.2 hypothetical protein CC1G_09877 [Coprinopsis cinerea okayama7\